MKKFVNQGDKDTRSGFGEGLTELGRNNVYLNDIFYCPHHPDKGFKNELRKFKINCSCRKPKPGMIFKAQKYYNIDLETIHYDQREE